MATDTTLYTEAFIRRISPHWVFMSRDLPEWPWVTISYCLTADDAEAACAAYCLGMGARRDNCMIVMITNLFDPSRDIARAQATRLADVDCASAF